MILMMVEGVMVGVAQLVHLTYCHSDVIRDDRYCKAIYMYIHPLTSVVKTAKPV